MNTVMFIPYINPFHFVRKGFLQDPDYHTKHIDDYFFEDIIQPWETFIHFELPWQLSDPIKFQVVSNFGPINASLVDCDGREWLTQQMAIVSTDADDPAMRYYEANIDVSSLPEGVYRIQMETEVETWIGNKLHILQSQPDTVLLEYRHHEHKDGVIFELGFSPSLRIPAYVRFRETKSKRTSFEDQTLGVTTLTSRSFRVFRFTSRSEGYPDFLQDIIARAVECSETWYDGRLLSVAPDANWEEGVEEDYPMRGWSIDLRETLNRGAKIFSGTANITGRYSIITLSDSEGFGMDTGGNMQEVTDVI